jgi:anthranilate synthase/aminodeoxychorismate synthase-like glutamine amidotransferase
MILMIDNYDSFTYNLVQYLGEMGQELLVCRNDEITLSAIKKMKPERIVISPGPGNPESAGLSMAVIQKFGATIPILGVCLGHQCMGQVYGGRVVLADKIMHGKTSLIQHNQHKLFRNMDNPFSATRYHSLIVSRQKLPSCLEVIAWTESNEIMGLAHKTHPVWGVQFHPESILTPGGKDLIRNFLQEL